MGLAGYALPAQDDRDEWVRAAAGSDACLAPVLSIDEAPEHPHMKASGTYVRFDDVRHPRPAPRFGQTPSGLRRPTPVAGQHSLEMMGDWGVAAAIVESARAVDALSDA